MLTRRVRPAVALLALATTAALAGCSAGLVPSGASPAAPTVAASSSGDQVTAASGGGSSVDATSASGASVQVNGDCADVRAPGVVISGCGDGTATIHGTDAGGGAAAPVPAAAGCPASPTVTNGSYVNANLSGKDLRCASITGEFTNANLSAADLAGATLTGEFTNANLSRANLRGTTLDGDFANANFTGADLTGLHVSAGVDVTNANFRDATCPTGRPAVGDKCGF